MSQDEIVLAFTGKENSTLWDIPNPPFDGSAVGVTLDACVMCESRVPFRYHDGVDYWLDKNGSQRKCMTYVFKLDGPKENQDQQMQAVGAFTHALTHDWDKFHVAFRSLRNMETGAIRTFVYRIYENVEGECFEHPEMLSGEPCGMYHCPVCMHMIVAGIPHPSKEDLEEM